MSDHNERACGKCGSLLHHEDDCIFKLGREHLYGLICGSVQRLNVNPHEITVADFLDRLMGRQKSTSAS